MPEYKLTNEAKEDFIRIYQYGESQFGLQQAEKYFNTLYEHFDLIAQQPYAFESVDFIKLGYRRCVCGSDSIFYILKNETVEIIAIIGRQDLDNIL